MIYLTAFVPIEGETAFEMAGGSECPFVSADDVSCKPQLSSFFTKACSISHPN